MIMKAKKDDVAFDGGTDQGYDLTIGSGQFIAGFEDGLIGVMPGETVDLNLYIPGELWKCRSCRTGCGIYGNGKLYSARTGWGIQ